MSDAASQAVDLVMVPGKLDCPVPVNLLMRAVGGSESLVDIAALFSDMTANYESVRRSRRDGGGE